ncbi:MAG: copper-binding protein [Acidobacteria bacterium]|nr:copper-binding protein [Acidobacteriota bacterium]MBV9069520.1 copper-binding protein [Acidobacteriota bacterium]MBV9186966.1 copper-binding protein [Acidobacteriota bacterium]
MKRFTICILLFVFALALPVMASEKTGSLTGTIVNRETSTNQLTVSHGAIPGLMGAMTMPYEVRGQEVTSLPKNGAKIAATLHESAGAYWLTDVKPAEETGAPGHDVQSMPQSHEHAGMEHPAATPQAKPVHGMPDMPGMKMTTDTTADFLMRQASGTSMNPAAAPMHMSMTQYGDWMLMLHGLAFVNQVVQSGPRGDDKLFSTNWIMGMADRPLGGGHLMLRSMLSLEPLTVGKKYPELFQTGETTGGRPIIDAQHPHDFFMEVAAEYAHPLTDTTIGYIYAAPFGDPALGPVAYPHRASASEIPQAALSHHVQDSTHIAGSVITIGAQSGMFGYAVSGFHGREPDEKRWDIDTGKIDSWAARVTFDPTPNWTAQLSTGHLKHPEAAEPGDIQRTTASVSYSKASTLGQTIGQWDTSLIFGHNRKSEGKGGSSILAESVLQFAGTNYVTGRAEIVDKDELFAGQNVPLAISSGAFRIKALTIGYSRDVIRTGVIAGAVGANVTAYSIPGAIKPYYGNPHSFYVFLRVRGQGAGMHDMHSMHK